MINMEAMTKEKEKRRKEKQKQKLTEKNQCDAT
jgi:hypothetical protein